MTGRPDRWIVIPDWDEFQHYKDRAPLWIKTYTRLLHDDAYLDLDIAARGILHGLWLLYADLDGVVSESRARAILAPSGTHRGSHRVHTGNISRAYRRHIESLNDAGF